MVIAAVVLTTGGFAAGWAAVPGPHSPNNAVTTDAEPEAAVCALGLGISRDSLSSWDDEAALRDAEAIRAASQVAPEGPIRKAGIDLASGIPTWVEEPDEGRGHIAAGLNLLRHECDQRFTLAAYRAVFADA